MATGVSGEFWAHHGPKSVFLGAWGGVFYFYGWASVKSPPPPKPHQPSVLLAGFSWLGPPSSAFPILPLSPTFLPHPVRGVTPKTGRPAPIKIQSGGPGGLHGRVYGGKAARQGVYRGRVMPFALGGGVPKGIGHAQRPAAFFKKMPGPQHMCQPLVYAKGQKYAMKPVWHDTG